MQKLNFVVKELFLNDILFLLSSLNSFLLTKLINKAKNPRLIATNNKMNIAKILLKIPNDVSIGK